MNRRRMLLAAPACVGVMSLPGLALARAPESFALCSAGPCAGEVNRLTLAAIRLADEHSGPRRWSLAIEQAPWPAREIWSMQRDGVPQAGRMLRQTLAPGSHLDLLLESTCRDGSCNSLGLRLPGRGSYLIAAPRTDGSLPTWHRGRMASASESDLITLMNGPSSVDYDAIVLTLSHI
jgi:hypothetical protein